MTGEEMRKIRLDRKMSQEVFARKLELSRATVSRAENGTPNKNTVLRIENALRQKKI